MKKLILGSQSPRRAELLDLIDLPYEVRVRTVDEVYPDDLEVDDVAAYLAKLKASVFDDLGQDEILITSDSVVIMDGVIFGKPKSREEGLHMIAQYSNTSHKVVTGVCIRSRDLEVVFSDTAVVYMATISEKEARYYYDRYQPTDKAGAYGIQEWIGYAKITKIEGTFATIMGLPVQKVYAVLQESFNYPTINP